MEYNVILHFTDICIKKEVKLHFTDTCVKKEMNMCLYVFISINLV